MKILEDRVSAVMREVTGIEDVSAMVQAAADAKFGHYQANGVMSAAKSLKTNPRSLAADIVEKLDISDICEVPEIAGPGFINMRLRKDFLGRLLLEINEDKLRLGVEKAEFPCRAVVDFSGPNIAKQMHVGHLRSTIIGDGICRVLDFLGYDVVRQNHIGDWGTQFGMLIAYLRRNNPEILERPETVKISDLEQFYRNAKALCDEDSDFAAQSRREVIDLHNHKEDTLLIWRHIVDESRRHYQPIYDYLNVNLDSENERGESFYAGMLSDVVEELKKKGLAEESDGAICVFPEGFKNKDDDPLPFIIQKSDGAFLYATTDLAALRYRVRQLAAKSIIYVTDARQKLHFEMLFAVGRLAGWVPEEVKLSHVTFGSVLGDDGKPFKTRSGDSVKLKDLLDEAVERAHGVVEQKSPELDSEKKEIISRAVGVGAIKYADYSNNRTSDYVFSFDKMLAMDGNTAPYMQYAYARVKSIERKAEADGINIAGELGNIDKVNLTEKEELDLAIHLLRYGEIIDLAASDYRLNYITAYLYELAQKFSVFYNCCPVLKAETDKRPTRVLLCDLTARVIRHGLTGLLGIEVVEQM